MGMGWWRVDQRRLIAGDTPAPEADIDVSVAHPARVHNYLAGGNAHFAADREAVDQAAAVLPGGLETARRAVRAMAAFQARVVHHLAAEAGIDQFVKLGTVVPAGEDVHEIAQSAAAGTRVVYVGSDPTVLAHAHSLRQATPAGTTAYVHASVDEVEVIVEQVAKTLDWSRPVALLLLPAPLNFVSDRSDPYGIVARFVSAVPSGSYLALGHTSAEVGSERMLEAAERFSKMLGEPYIVRSRDEIARFFAGLDLVEPGVVPIDQWRPSEAPPPPGPSSAGSDPSAAARRPVPIYGALARKP